MKTTTKNFQVEELENRLEMATIDGVGGAAAPDDDNKSCTNQGCTQNSGCAADTW